MEWTKTLVTAKIEKKRSEYAKLQGSGPKAILAAILASVKEASSSDSPSAPLELVVSVHFALSHHSAVGGLKQSQMEKMIKIVQSVLDAYQIRPKSSRIAWLRADLHSLASQGYRRIGQHRLALWQQFLAEYAAGEGDEERNAFRTMMMAARLLRLGFTEQTERSFLQALAENLPLENRPHAHLGIMRCQLWSGRFKDVESSLQSYLPQTTNPGAISEFQWVAAVMKFLTTKDLRPILNMVRKGGTHYQGSYLLETVALAHMSNKVNWMAEVPRIEFIKSYPKLSVADQGPWFTVVVTLQSLYDTAQSPMHRIGRLHQAIELSDSLTSIDKTLMVLLAGYRWSKRARLDSVANYLRLEIENLSLRLSNGRTKDVWNQLE